MNGNSHFHAKTLSQPPGEDKPQPNKVAENVRVLSSFEPIEDETNPIPISMADASVPPVGAIPCGCPRERNRQGAPPTTPTRMPAGFEDPDFDTHPASQIPPFHLPPTFHNPAPQSPVRSRRENVGVQRGGFAGVQAMIPGRSDHGGVVAAKGKGRNVHGQPPGRPRRLRHPLA